MKRVEPKLQLDLNILSKKTHQQVTEFIKSQRAETSQRVGSPFSYASFRILVSIFSPWASHVIVSAWPKSASGHIRVPQNGPLTSQLHLLILSPHCIIFQNNCILPVKDTKRNWSPSRAERPRWTQGERAENLTCEEIWNGLGLFTLQRRLLWGEWRFIFECLGQWTDFIMFLDGVDLRVALSI